VDAEAWGVKCRVPGQVAEAYVERQLRSGL
jgi:hypothetical protein